MNESQPQSTVTQDQPLRLNRCCVLAIATQDDPIPDKKPLQCGSCGTSLRWDERLSRWLVVSTVTETQPERVWVIGPVPVNNLLHERYVCSQPPNPPPPTLTTEYIRADLVRAGEGAAAPKAALVQELVNAVWANVKRYDDGEMWLDNVKASAAVNKLLHAAQGADKGGVK